jgi:hypothetical protein
MRRHVATDLLLLGLVVAASVAPYGCRLGFYSDDWSTLGTILNSPDQSFAALSTTEVKYRMRPTQVAYETILVKLFGLKPLGYHLVNAAVLAFASQCVASALGVAALGMEVVIPVGLVIPVALWLRLDSRRLAPLGPHLRGTGRTVLVFSAVALVVAICGFKAAVAQAAAIETSSSLGFDTLGGSWPDHSL